MSESIAQSVAEYGAHPCDNAILTCGPHTGHFFRPVAFCADDGVASLLAAAPRLVTALEAIGQWIGAVEDSPITAAHNIADAFRLYAEPAIRAARQQEQSA